MAGVARAVAKVGAERVVVAAVVAMVVGRVAALVEVMGPMQATTAAEAPPEVALKVAGRKPKP